MTTIEFRAIQKKLFQALRDRPLNLMNEEDSKLYEHLHDERHDPVKRLFDTIDFSEVASVQLVAGFRGTGKTTEFSRLERDLWKADFHVIRVDLDEYVDMHSAVDIRDFLLILAGAISDQLTKESLLGGELGLKKSFWERVVGLMPASKEITARVAIPDVKLALRSDSGYRAQVREKFAGRLAELTNLVREYHSDILKALEQKAGRPVRLVVILDSLEHLRGTGDSADDIRRSVEELFLTHAARISLPSTHMVLSVPAFLALQADNLEAQFVNGSIQAWPAYQVQNRAGEGMPVIDRMIQVVEKRGDWRQILPNQEALRKLIVASGGHLRDLLNMLIESIHLASYGVSPDVAEKVINVATRAYAPLYKDEIDVLRRINQDKDTKNINVDEREYLLRFLDAGVVLCYLNDDFWYDVHPLVRNIVRGS